MSERDDSFLNTGVNSASSRTRQAQRAESDVQRAHERILLTPAEEIIYDVIAEELSKARNVETVTVDVHATEETFKAILTARRMNIEFIKAFQANIQNKLRQKPQKKKRPQDG